METVEPNLRPVCQTLFSVDWSVRNAARTLDLDVLWSSGRPSSSSSSSLAPVVPHARLLQRGFAVIPLMEAMQRAGLPVPHTIRMAAATAQLRPPLMALPAVRLR